MITNLTRADTATLSILRGGASAARLAHNQKVAGSIPAPVISAVQRSGERKATDTNFAARPRTVRFFLLRRNAAAAPVLAGIHRPAFHNTDEERGMFLQLPPQPARFFFCPRKPRSRHARGLRLVWLLGVNGQLG